MALYEDSSISQNMNEDLSQMRKAEVQYKGCESFQDIMKFYQQRSAVYDKIMEKVHDVSPKMVARLLLDCGAGLEDKILDAAAGTGAVAVQLENLGFSNIDALEPCEMMVKKAKEHNVYKNIIQAPLGEGNFPIQRDSYDHATLSAAFCPSHVKLQGLMDLCNAVKPGGLIVFNIREDYLTKVPMYMDLEKFVDSMESSGFWTKVLHMLLPYDCEYKAYYFVYRVCDYEEKNCDNIE